jgi:hypothetical protein
MKNNVQKAIKFIASKQDHEWLRYRGRDYLNEESTTKLKNSASVLVSEVKRLRTALEQIRDFDFEQECLPECWELDGYHADLCPWANKANVMVHIAKHALEVGNE